MRAAVVKAFGLELCFKGKVPVAVPRNDPAVICKGKSAGQNEGK